VAHARCIPGQEFQPRLCSVGIPPVRAVRIEWNGIPDSSQGSSSSACKTFKLTAATVRKYLAGAMAYEASQGHYTLSTSTCSIRGSLVFVDGRSATWQVGNLREGWLKMHGAATQHLYCPACRFKPFND
jgi:hypothetical protein